MTKALLFLLFLIVAGLGACRKAPDTDPVSTLQGPVVQQLKPDRFFTKDTTMGKGQAVKNGTFKWVADAECSGHSNYQLIFHTYALDKESRRELIVLGPLPADCEGKRYPLYNLRDSRAPRIAYQRFYSDGDLVQDSYMLDTTASNNFVSVHKLDRVNKRIEGSFSAQFLLRGTSPDPLNPDTLRFTSGRFWAVLPE